MTNFLSPTDLTLEQTKDLLALAAELKKNPIRRDLAGKILGCVFFNSSLRTRVSFDVAMQQLGGAATVLNIGEGTWNLEHREGVVMDGKSAEHIHEAAAVLGRYCDALALRAFPKYDESWEDNLEEPIHRGFARYGGKPLINMESALHHPCQSLADMMTIQEKAGDPKGQPIVVSWAWHMNPLPMAVTNSIFTEAAKFGMEVRLAHPPGWELDPAVMNTAEELAAKAGGSVKVYHDFREALPGARALYFKSWGSLANYGDPATERGAALNHKDRWHLRLEHFDQTDDAIWMHCLPARRGVEVEEAVFNSRHSAVIDEAENRLHVQKALLLQLLGGR